MLAMIANAAGAADVAAEKAAAKAKPPAPKHAKVAQRAPRKHRAQPMLRAKTEGVGAAAGADADAPGASTRSMAANGSILSAPISSI